VRTAWLDFWTGLAGDMFVGALLDAGWEADRLRRAVDSFGLGPLHLEIERRTHQGFTGLGIRVVPPPDSPHRGLREIRAILGAADVPREVRSRALEVFALLAEVEGRIHGTEPERVHFHEVGAADALVDIVGTVLGLHDLGVDKVVAGPVPIGGGEIRMAHGLVPGPAPATAILLEGWPVRPAGVEGEFFTPTAAALLRSLARPAVEMPAMRIERVGYGAGTRRHPTRPNLIRIWIGSEDSLAGGNAAGMAAAAGPAADPVALAPLLTRVAVLETQIDDMDPRFLASVADSLLAEGALDVYRAPVLMKKGRLGVLLSVICRVPEAGRISGLILSRTTTLGVRMREEGRWELPRRTETVRTELGEVRLKWAGLAGSERPAPEYEDLLRISQEHGLSLEEVQRRILRSMPDPSPGP
jgi:pyridinium-3,5-bisthiocarboxylic acid mononucleotide nickel chelatase